jgi:hypothetical protein
MISSLSHMSRLTARSLRLRRRCGLMRLRSRLRFIPDMTRDIDPGQSETEDNDNGDSEWRFGQSHHRPLRQNLEPLLSACALTISTWSPSDR